MKEGVIISGLGGGAVAVVDVGMADMVGEDIVVPCEAAEGGLAFSLKSMTGEMSVLLRALDRGGLMPTLVEVVLSSMRIGARGVAVSLKAWEGVLQSLN